MRMYHIAISWSAATGTGSRNFQIELWHYTATDVGTVLDNSIHYQNFKTADEYQSGANHVICTLKPNEYVQLRVKCVANTSDFKVSHFNLFAAGMGKIETTEYHP